MPLSDLPLPPLDAHIPDDVQRFLREAERRIDAYQHDSSVPGFVASDPEESYRVLRGVAESLVAPGALFCEWGSGFGVIACLASMIGFEAVGIEIEAELVDHARHLAGDFKLPVEFLHGSFIPPGGAVHCHVDLGTTLAWLNATEARRDDLPFDADDFDVIFAYPWPDEQDVTAVLFERYARPGALFVSHHYGQRFRIRRKVARKRSV